jgi:hypothetical protein
MSSSWLASGVAAIGGGTEPQDPSRRQVIQNTPFEGLTRPLPVVSTAASRCGAYSEEPIGPGFCPSVRKC